MADAYFSIIVWTHNPNMDFFKNMLESIDDQEYRNFELYILDDAKDSVIERTIKEFYPDIVDKVHYRQLKKKDGGAYAYNIGSHFAEGDYFVYVGQHDRLNPNTLTELNLKISSLSENGIIYTDHDELVGLDRMNPHFKSDFNKELYLHTPYIGDFICISKEAYQKLGPFNEKARYAYIYEYVLRACSKKIKIEHIASLLYHERAKEKPITKEAKAETNYAYKEYMALAQAHLNAEGVECQVRGDGSYKKWIIDYDHSSFRRFGGDYMYFHEDNVRLYTRKNVERMYGYLLQPDVAVVGVRFIDRGFTFDNVGFIFDQEGILYPAFHGKKIYQATYENLASIPRDVAAVDAGCCLIDEKIYRKLGGFDTSLSGRDAMLDFCLRAKERGYRTIVVPEVVARYKKKDVITTEESNSTLKEKHVEAFEAGDLLYNKNLPLGVDNYYLPGTEE